MSLSCCRGILRHSLGESIVGGSDRRSGLPLPLHNSVQLTKLALFSSVAVSSISSVSFASPSSPTLQRRQTFIRVKERRPEPTRRLGSGQLSLLSTLSDFFPHCERVFRSRERKCLLKKPSPHQRSRQHKPHHPNHLLISITPSLPPSSSATLVICIISKSTHNQTQKYDESQLTRRYRSGATAHLVCSFCFCSISSFDDIVFLIRWIEAWSSQITTGLALFLVLCGVLTTISLFTPICIVAGLLQL